MNTKTGKKTLFFNQMLLGNKAFFIAILMAVVIGLFEPIFFSTANLFNVLRQICSSTIMAMGFTFVLGLGEIDLSVGAILGLNGVIMGKLMTEAGWPVWLAIAAALFCGVLFGMINSSIISALNIPPFIVTLATQSLFRGTLYIITGMVPISTLPNEFVQIGQGYLGVFPIPVLIMLVVILAAFLIANYSTFGRHV
ncbi:MAG: ABC transporter permease, partial [Oscillospiraceae bacterium]